MADLVIPSIVPIVIRVEEHHEGGDDLGGAFVTTIAPADPLRLDPPGIELGFDAVYDGVPLD